MVYGVEVGHGKSDDDDAASQAGDVADTFFAEGTRQVFKKPDDDADGQYFNAHD